jgi:hypothetical protein
LGGAEAAPAGFSGETIATLLEVTNLKYPESDDQIMICTGKAGVTKAVRLLLSSVTKVLCWQTK